MNTDKASHYLEADWPAPSGIKAFTSTRLAPDMSELSIENAIKNTHYHAFNLGMHVGDDAEQVKENRLLLAQSCHLSPEQFCWLDQVHGTEVVEASSKIQIPQADASYTRQVGQACVIMTADCLPVLLCDQQGKQVAAAHAGWRSLAAGILEKTVATFNKSDDVIAWFGPAISQKHFEVGDEVYETFCQRYEHAEKAFIRGTQNGKWFADLYHLARLALNSVGVTEIYGGQHCSFEEDQKFYSFRRDKQTAGRMASVIYIDSSI